jgi:hypothetical protein
MTTDQSPQADAPGKIEEDDGVSTREPCVEVADVAAVDDPEVLGGEVHL